MASAPLTISLGMTGEQAVAGAFNKLGQSIKGVGTAAGSGVTGALKGMGSALGGIASIAGGAALGYALTQMPGQLMDMAKGAAEDEKATARLQQTLKNLPGDFNQMSAAVDGAIKSGQKLAFSDDDIRDSFQFLATATGDSQKVLDRQKIALDLARGANIPLAQASKLVGKVNSENVETFKKLGITIGEGASEADALAAVQAKFAGQSEAYAKSTAGQFEAAQLAMGEIQESIGSALLPVFTALATTLANMLPVIQEWIGAFTSGIAEIVGPAISGLVAGVQQVFTILGGGENTGDANIFDDIAAGIMAVRDLFMPAIQPILDILPSLGEALGQAFGFFTTGAGDIEVFRGVLTKLVGPEGAQMIIEVFTNVVGFVQDTVIPMFQSFGNIVSLVLKGKFGEAIVAAIEHIAKFSTRLITTLADWGMRFITWVAPLIPPLLLELGKLGLRLLGWIGEQVQPILAALKRWAGEFIAWVGPLIPPLLLELGKLILRLLNWIGQQEAELTKKFITEWVPAAIKWVGEAIKDIIPKLGDFLKAIGAWIADEGAPAVGRAALGLGKAMIDGIGKGIANFGGSINDAVLNAVRSALGAGERAIRDWVGRLPGMGGGGAAAPSGASVSSMGIGAPITINNVIDARGMSPDRVTYAVGDPLATLMRTRVNPRSYS